MRLTSYASILVLAVVIAGAGCSSTQEPATNAGGTGGASGQSGTGGANAGQVGVSGAAGTMQGGSGHGGAVGAGGSFAPGGAPPGGTPSVGGSPAGGGAGGTGAIAGAGGSVAGSAGQAGGGSVGKAACADNTYDLCLDFETGIDTAKWTGGTASAIETTDFAHGTHAYRLYPNPGGLLKATNLGKITNQMWGRFYVHFKPGAPGGHGNIVAAFDQANNWYEMGWQFDAMMGVWHASNNGERPLRSKPFIVDQWYCIETYFDGTKTEMPKWWIDGKEAEYYMSANEALIPKALTQFARVEVGFSPYANLALQMPDGKGPKDDRFLTDMAIDDIAFDTDRIGCISP
jgi:hypothetical protein